MDKDEKQMMAFSAIDKRIVENIPKFTQEQVSGKSWVYYGEDNLYCEYLAGLVESVATLKTIITTTADYITGDDVIGNVPGFETYVNKSGETWRELIKKCALDYQTFGGFAIQVIRNFGGQISELYWVDFRYLRTDKKNECFFYSEDFAKRYVRSSKTIVYPRYISGGDAPASIVYFKNSYSTPYPIPRYSGAIKACEIERRIDDMHLNGLANGFMPSFMINFNQGVPTDEQKVQLEKDIESKFCGNENAGRVLLNFSNGKENAATIQKLDVSDFGEKYKSAADRAREQIYCSMGATPVLFGLVTESNGFSDIEFESAFKLYNSTVIRSIQRSICDAIDRIFGKKQSITIKPFTFDLDNNQNNNTNNTTVS